MTVTDGALPESLFAPLTQAVRAIGARADYWRSFWLPAAPSTSPCGWAERAALELLRRVPPPRPVVGLEWWLGWMRTNDVPLEFHHDRDNALHDRTGRIRHPRWSSVLYLSRCRGGALVVTDQRLLHRGPEYLLSPPEARRLAHVQPRENLLARFDGRLLHGVLDAHNAVPSAPLPDTAGEPRMTLVMNGWGRRPEGLERWRPEELYPELAMDGSDVARR